MVKPLYALLLATLYYVYYWMHIAAVLTQVLVRAPLLLTSRARFLALRNQLLFAGVQELLLISFLAFLLAVGLVQLLQTYPLLGSAEAPPNWLIDIIVSQVNPMLINMALIIRSGSAIISLLAYMSIQGEVRVLEAQGIGLFNYVLLPRVVGNGISVFCLGVVMTVGVFACVYIYQVATGNTMISPVLFTEHVMSHLGAREITQAILATVVPAAVITCVCCVEGLSSRGAFTALPKSVARGMAMSLTTLLVVTAFITIGVETCATWLGPLLQ